MRRREFLGGLVCAVLRAQSPGTKPNIIFILADDFARAIDTVGTTLLDVHASRMIYSITEAALESCRTGQVVL